MTWTRLITRFLIVFAAWAAVLFAAAGRLNWWMGWAYIGSLVIFTIVGRAVVMVKNPDLLEERAASFNKEDVKPWDRVLVLLMVVVLPLLMMLVAGLDVRFGWSPPIALGVKLAAWAVLLFGMLVANWALIENSFFSGTVRIQKERDHSVVSTGPYAWVRHPGYAGALVANIVTPIMLGALWALIPAVILCAVTVLRTVLEDNALQHDLNGYAAYAGRVRYRLVPLVW